MTHLNERADRLTPAHRRLGRDVLLDRLIKAAGFLHPELLASEPGLIAKKWPAYRGLDPMSANLQFAQEYSDAFRWQYRKDVDLNEARSVRGIDFARILYPKDDVGNKAKGGQLTSLHRADESGLPYSVFVSFCMDFASNRNCRRIPQPNQLVPVKFKATWLKKLAQRQADFREAMLHRYRSELERGYVGPPGCAGVVGATADECGNCKYVRVCSKLKEAVRKEMKARGDQLYADKRAAVLRERNMIKAQRERERRAVMAARRVEAKTQSGRGGEG
jgi:hypothetical protein